LQSDILTIWYFTTDKGKPRVTWGRKATCPEYIGIEGLPKGQTLSLPEQHAVRLQGFLFGERGVMKRVMRKVARKVKRHPHKKHLSFLQAVRIYGGMSAAA
jgi:hypothetical protein